MWNEPTENQLRKMPALYSTENTSLDNILIHMHFFLGGCDWYMAEYSFEDRIFFGYAILNNDYENAEWGYTSLDEMLSIKIPPGIEIDRDLHWTPTRAGNIEKIVSSGGIK